MTPRPTWTTTKEETVQPHRSLIAPESVGTAVRTGPRTLATSLPLVLVAVPELAMAAAGAAEATAEAAGVSMGAAIGAGLAVGLAAIGAGIAVGIAGAAAIGAITEKPEVLGRTLIFIGLAEGIAIYGLIVAFMLLTGFGG
ncbi:ATPase [bacterium]|nr:ATPase [bacterium]